MQDNSLTPRNLEIVERLFRDDSTFEDLATDYDTTKDRIRFIFISIFRTMQRPDLLEADIELPDHDCFDLPILRQNRDLWLGQIEKLRKIVRNDIENPLTAHLNVPVRLTKETFFVNTFEALKRAFVAFNNHRQPGAFETFKTPEHFPCFVKIYHSDRGNGCLKFYTISMAVVDNMMDNYQHYN
jgi:hypothetical protein